MYFYSGLVALLLICVDSYGTAKTYEIDKFLRDSILQSVVADDSDLNPDQFQFNSVKQPPMRILRELNIGDSNKAWVIDSAVSYEDFDSFMTYIRYGNTDFTFAHQNYSKPRKQDWAYGSAPWVREMDLKTFNQSKVWKRLRPLVEETLANKVRVQHAKIDFIRALDPMRPQKSSFCGANRYILSFFVTDLFKLNSYGQLSFYTMSQNKNMSDEPRLEITESVHPHGFRATLWPACHVVLFRAPSVNFFQHLMQLHVVLTTDVESNKEVTSIASFAPKQDTVYNGFGNFKFTNIDVNRLVDYNACLTRTLYDGSKKRPIYVFDGLFTRNELLQWRSHLLKANAHLNGFDSEPSEGHDNVQWMKSLNPDNFPETDMWSRLQQLLRYIDNSTEWSPYDVALNYIRSADHTRIHPDAQPNEEEFTILLYLSEGLTPSDYGETNWVIRKKNAGILGYIGPGGEMYETIAAVAPKFGRLVAFRNNIEHSAHPPSVLYLGGRFSFAVKVAKNRRLGFIKRLYESMSDVHDQLKPHMTKLWNQLMRSKHDEPTVSSLSNDFIESMFYKLAKERNVQDNSKFVTMF